VGKKVGSSVGGFVTIFVGTGVDLGMVGYEVLTLGYDVLGVAVGR